MKIIFSTFFVVFLVILRPFCIHSQDVKYLKNVSFEYGVQKSMADLKDRFGSSFELGGHFELISGKNLLVFGASGHFIFGNDVKEDVLENLRTTEGQIIGNDRQFASVFLRQRGFNTQFYVGKLFNFLEQHPISGIKATIGVGLIQHRIRVQDDSRTVTQLTGDYLKGYDRLTNGLSLNSFLGYQHMNRQGRVNFLAGFDLSVGFTKNRRDFDFSTFQKDDQNRIDILAGFKVGWMLTIGGSRIAADQIIY